MFAGLSALEEVLQHLVTGCHLDGTEAEALEMTPDEVLHALHGTPSGKSPGHDGIPMELYRKFKASLAP